MRELKFRVWLPEHDTFIFPQFIYPHICDFIRGNDTYVIGQLVPYFKYEKGLKFDARFVNSNFDKNQMGEVNDYIDDIEHVIQQYIGLKDKNGKEIYEGDILKLRSLHYEVLNIDGQFIATCPNYCQYNWPKFENFVREARCSEVAGNIFQTPELLKQ